MDGGDLATSGEIPEYLRMVAALVFVVGLMGALAFVLKKLGIGGNMEAKIKRKGRLGIVEVLPLDGRRRVALIQRDDKEHLVIFGANGETVIETGIEPLDNKTHEP